MMTRPSTKLLCLLVLSLLVFSALSAKKGGAKDKGKAKEAKKVEFIDTMEHEIQPLTPGSFDHNIRKFRDDKISAVLFYQPNKDTKKIVDGWYNKAAKELKGMIKIAALDCQEAPVFCKEQNVKEFPKILIYPPNPLPVVPFESAKSLHEETDHKPFVNLVTRYIPSSNIKEVDDKNHDDFLSSKTSLPKVLLFTDKKGFPTIYKALSSHFKKEMSFGIVKKDTASLVKKYAVTKFPLIVVIRPGKAGSTHDTYGKDAAHKMEYKAIYDWINVFAETFASGGGFSDATHSPSGAKDEPKPWTVQRIPEVTKASANDVCFKKEGLCVIYLKSKGPLEASEEDMLDKMKSKFESKLADRGTHYRWLWMDMGIETEFRKLFDVSLEGLPSLVVFNPHKRLRFTKLESSSVTEKSIESLIDKISGGDARFKMVPGQKLPEFASRVKAATKEEL